MLIINREQRNTLVSNVTPLSFLLSPQMFSAAFDTLGEIGGAGGLQEACRSGDGAPPGGHMAHSSVVDTVDVHKGRRCLNITL